MQRAAAAVRGCGYADAKIKAVAKEAVTESVSHGQAENR